MKNVNLQKFTIEIQQETEILKINSIHASCPFRNPVMLPHPQIQGQAVIQNPVCSSQCQFFNRNETQLILDCTKTKIILQNNQNGKETSPKDTNIIQFKKH
jgi:hypothetical protein